MDKVCGLLYYIARYRTLLTGACVATAKKSPGDGDGEKKRRVPRVRIAAERIANLRKKAGRLPDFTPELVGHVLDRVAEGGTISGVARELGIDRGTLFKYFLHADEEIKQQYTRARISQHQAWADDIVHISDTEALIITDSGRYDAAAVQAARLRTDNRRWLLSKLHPGEYGDKQSVEHTGKGGTPLIFQACSSGSSVSIDIDTGESVDV
jgi:hypothetical protein